jgi:hypothetical protein
MFYKCQQTTTTCYILGVTSPSTAASFWHPNGVARQRRDTGTQSDQQISIEQALAMYRSTLITKATQCDAADCMFSNETCYLYNSFTVNHLSVPPPSSVWPDRGTSIGNHHNNANIDTFGALVRLQTFSQYHRILLRALNHPVCGAIRQTLESIADTVWISGMCIKWKLQHKTTTLYFYRNGALTDGGGLFGHIGSTRHTSVDDRNLQQGYNPFQSRVTHNLSPLLGLNAFTNHGSAQQ